jgi:hypothetical protein
MKFFNLDCHISVIQDIKDIFSDLGHQVDSWCISGHNWVLNNSTPNVDVVNVNNWKHIDDDMCNRFYDRYKNELNTYDGYIVTYPPVFAKLFEKFEKPVIMYVPIRYEVPYTNNPIEWERFNDYLRTKIDSKLVVPVANSLYDQKYSEYFIERNFHYIPNICEYTKTTWNPKTDLFLYSSKLDVDFGNPTIYNKKLLGKYSWNSLTKFKGIINIPYNCSTMSIFEHYTANIPMFFPTINFMIELYKQHNRNGVLSELTWNQVQGMPPGSLIKTDKNDPNMYSNVDLVKNWIQYSDFYNIDIMPHLQYFNSFKELQSMLEITDLNTVSNNMKIQNKLKKENVYSSWKKIIEAYY